MRTFRDLITTLAILSLATACSPRAASVFKQQASLLRDESLLKDFALSPEQAAPVERAVAIEALGSADLTSIGESHEDGLERRVIAELYRDLFLRAGTPRRCLVESYDNLIGADGKPEPPGREDPVRPVFNARCKPALIFDNPTWDYGGELTRLFPSRRASGFVLSHTGYRHMLPFGKVYGVDFEPHSLVDLHERGTIALQVPSSFSSSGRKSASFAPLSLDRLLVAWLGREIARGSNPEALEARLDEFLDSPSLQFEGVKFFELKRVSRAILHHRAFAGVFDPGIFKREGMKALLRSPELAAFLTEARGGKIRHGYFRGGPDFPGTFSLGGRQLTGSGIFFLAFRPRGGNEEVYLYVDSALKIERIAQTIEREN